MLEAKTSANFDQSFIQAQVGVHTQAVIMVDVFRDYASADLRPTLELAGTTLRVHIEQATARCKKCDAGARTGKQLENQK